MKCQSAGCQMKATWGVGYKNRKKKVCRKCRDELCAVYGWELKRSLFNKHREGAK